ncbi:hypothetical protein D9619_012811 [Psilocybe cf. subviscida]|uniref:Enoyl reductase (ER) domain-containing protein n=1 Tax=Psilocybe cf. subviscida TaxID=2480587 RepID=A0A8H5AS15_9AGAR|nr:hypothetical protein D9619_012811 [Psilocybe cf. subviscida]
MAPTTQKALYLEKKQGDFIIGDIIPVPKPKAGEVLIKVMAAGLNPIDWALKATGMYIENYPAVLGFDYAGIVEELGDGVVDLKVGDRVFSESSFQKGHEGFQQYALGIASTMSKIPNNISFDQAGTIGVTLATAVVGLYQTAPNGLGVTVPSLSSPPAVKPGTPFVVIGGTTSVGQYAIQLAKFSGFSPIIATASLSNASYLQSLGATHVFDRGLSADDLKAQISAVTSVPIHHVFVTVAPPPVQELGLQILDKGGRVAVIKPQPEIKSGDGKEVAGVAAFLRMPKNIPLLEPFFHDLAAELLKKGIIKPNVIEVLPNGLHGVPDGLVRLGKGEVSALKLVVRPQDSDSKNCLVVQNVLACIIA